MVNVDASNGSVDEGRLSVCEEDGGYEDQERRGEEGYGRHCKCRGRHHVGRGAKWCYDKTCQGVLTVPIDITSRDALTE